MMVTFTDEHRQELSEDEMERIRRAQSEGGRRGGLKKNKNKGFGSSPERAKEAGRKGGKARWGKQDG